MIGLSAFSFGARLTRCDIPDMRGLIRSRVALCAMLTTIGIGLGVAVFILQKRSTHTDNSDLWYRGLESPLQVEARGREQAWRFSYSGPDGNLGTDDDSVSDGHLVLPAGGDAVLQLRSDDYLYVFSCPALELKEIAVPDLEFSLTIQVDRLGEYDLAMDPMCGFRLGPGETMGTLSVVSEDVFRRWLVARTRLR